MSRVATALAVLGLTGCAAKPVAVATPKPTSVQAPVPVPVPAGSINPYAGIPDQIGAFKLTERTVVRGAPADSLYRFTDGSSTRLSVFIYAVPADVKVDPDSQKWVLREGEKFKTIQEIMKSRGRIADFTVAFSDTVRFAAGTRSYLEHSIAVPTRYPDGAIAVEMQFMYLIGGKLLQVRATIPEPGWQQTKVPSFARELAIHVAGGR
jgi:hypothetical protein